MPHSTTLAVFKKMSDLKEKYMLGSDYIDSDDVLRQYKRFFVVWRLKKALYIGMTNSASARLLCSSFTCIQVNQKQAATGMYKCTKCPKGVYMVTELDLLSYASAPLPTFKERQLVGQSAKQITKMAFEKEDQLAKQKEQLFEKELRRCTRLVMLSSNNRLSEETLKADDSESPSKEQSKQSKPAHGRLSYVKGKALPELPGNGQRNRSKSPPPVHLRRADRVTQRGISRGQSISVRKEQEGPTYAVPQRFTRHASFSSSKSTLASNDTSSQATLCSQLEDQPKAIFLDDSMRRARIMDIKIKNGRTYF